LLPAPPGVASGRFGMEPDVAAHINAGAIGNLFNDAGGGGIGGGGTGGRGAAGNGAAAAVGTGSRARGVVAPPRAPAGDALCHTVRGHPAPPPPPPPPPGRRGQGKGSRACKCRHSAAGRALKLQEAAAKAAKPKAANTAECQLCATK
jgi:hypothetical protein